MYLHILKLIFGIKRELNQHSDAHRLSQSTLEESLRQINRLAEKIPMRTSHLEPEQPAYVSIGIPETESPIEKWLTDAKASTPETPRSIPSTPRSIPFTPRSIYPTDASSCSSERSMITVIRVVRAPDLDPPTPRSDVSLEDFWTHALEEKTEESRL